MVICSSRSQEVNNSEWEHSNAFGELQCGKLWFTQLRDRSSPLLYGFHFKRIISFATESGRQQVEACVARDIQHTLETKIAGTGTTALHSPKRFVSKFGAYRYL